MYHLEINQKCILCDNCRPICPEEAIIFIKNQFIIETHACTLCSLCEKVCPANAIEENDHNVKKQN